MASAEDPLEVVTGKIRFLFQKTDDHRATLAKLAFQAKQMVETGLDPYIQGRNWHTYAFEEFGGRHAGEIRKLVKMGGSPDPSAAHAREKAAARVGMARVRAQRANVSAPSDLTVNRVASLAPEANAQLIAPVTDPAAVTIATVKGVALRLSANDRALLAYWLISLLSAGDRATLAEWVLERETAPAAAA
jgi:hypothetical protein